MPPEVAVFPEVRALGGPGLACVATGDDSWGVMEPPGSPAGCGASAQALVPVQAEASAVALRKEAPQEAPKCPKRVLDEDSYIQVRGTRPSRPSRDPAGCRRSALGQFPAWLGGPGLFFLPPPGLPRRVVVRRGEGEEEENKISPPNKLHSIPFISYSNL